MSMRKFINLYFRTIKPKSKPLVYDYLQTEPDNPYKPDDELIPKKSERYLSSFELAFCFYIVAGYFIYFFTRLSYDYEWDRFYHVNYPAPMELFDVLSKHYIEKKDEFIKNLPSSISGFVNKYYANNTNAKIHYKDSKANRSNMVETETKISKEIFSLIQTGNNGGDDKKE
jgi:hypothetical protein